ncbi:MAG TPA: hypothetical protein VFP56_10420 [Candidatus Limnocylindrales bacterium]|nr:hypothetical protein [Candidatus Limnocylindrales bacterium]
MTAERSRGAARRISAARRMTVARRRIVRPGALLLLAALFAACASAPPASVAPTPTRAPLPTPLTTAYQLGTDVWYEGLVLHMDLATAVLDSRGGTVDIAFRIENAGAEPSDLDARMTLVVAGNRIAPTRESHIPTTPAGETALALLSFELQEIDSAEDGVLEIGADPDHIAKVPFGPAGGEAVTFQPVDLKLSGTTAASSLRITLRRGLIRWDLPDWSQELTEDLRALTLTYDATFTGTFSGGLAFTGNNVALRLPNGKIVEARPDGHSQSVELIGAGKTKRGLMSRFEIPASAKGKFGLVVRSGGEERIIAFTIKG